MKRTCAVAIVAVALGGCVSTEGGGGGGGGKYMAHAFAGPPYDPNGVHSGARLASGMENYQGPGDLPISQMAQGNTTADSSGEALARATIAKQLPPGVLQQLKINPYESLNGNGIQQVAGFGPGASCPPPGMPGGMPGFPGLPGMPGMGGLPPGTPGGMPPGLPILPGIQPPRMAGAVAAVGALNGAPSPFPNQRTEVRFVGPPGMKISWYTPGANGRPGFGKQYLEAPARYNFVQAAIYRLKLSDIPNRPGVELYPTLEVVPGKAKTCAFLSHSAVPITFTEEDFEQVAAGNYVVKVIYLPDPQFQDLASTGIDELVSSRLEPGVDPIVEAMRRGSILLVIRMGNIDLEAPNTPAMDAPPPANCVAVPMPPPGAPPGAPPAMTNRGPGPFGPFAGRPPLPGAPGFAPPGGMLPPVPGLAPPLPAGPRPPAVPGTPVGKADAAGAVQQAQYAPPRRPTVAELTSRLFSGDADKK